MNICVFVHAKTDAAEAISDTITNALLGYLAENNLVSEDVFRLKTGKTTLINTNRLSEVWSSAPYWRDEAGAVSLSALPVPVDRVLSAHEIQTDISSRIKNPASLKFLLPPFMGSYQSDDASGIFTDALGIGRAYVFESDLFFVASNAISPCLFYDRNVADEDHAAWQLFSGFGWFTGDSSPFKKVKRIPPATHIYFDRYGRKNETVYYPYEDYFRAREPANSLLAKTQSEMQTAARNISALAKKPPTLHLSGGRDSRLTSAVFLSLGIPLEVQTFGALSEEVTTASRLAQLAGKHAIHEVIERGELSSSEMPIPQRQSISMIVWDADMNPNRLSQKNLNLTQATKLTITGGGGEIAHGNYYASAAMLERVQKLSRPTDRLVSAFTGVGVTPDSAQKIEAFCDNLYMDMTSLGVTGPTMLDAFYLTERFRRWVAAGHSTSSPLLFAAPSFVRYSMDQTPEARLANVVHSKLINNLMPQWRNVPFYKAKPSEADEKLVKGLRIWQGAQSDEFFDMLLQASRDPLWDGRAVVEAAVQVLRGKSQPRMEAVFQKLLWRQGFIIHQNLLNKHIQKAWEPIRQGALARTPAPGIIRSIRSRVSATLAKL